MSRNKAKIQMFSVLESENSVTCIRGGNGKIVTNMFLGSIDHVEVCKPQMFYTCYFLEILT